MPRMHLGSFGTRRDPVDADFDYFGETIRVHPDASDLDHAELMIVAASIDVGDMDLYDPKSWTPEQRAAAQKANDAALNALRGGIHPEDWERFFKTAKKNRQKLTDLMSLSEAISEAATGFPTGQPSDSSPGRPDTTPKSRDTSSSRRAVKAARRALKELDGRPDLQMAPVHAYEAKVAEAG